MAKIRVDGESVMKKSRSLCYEEYKINEAIELLVNILQNDEMNDDEIRYLAMDILDGKFEIYNTKDGYDVKPIIPKDERYDFFGLINKSMEKAKEKEMDANEKINKLYEIIGNLKYNLTSTLLEGLNQDFYKAFGEKIWDDLPSGYNYNRFDDKSTMEENDYETFWGEIGSPRYEARKVAVYCARTGLNYEGPDPATLSAKMPNVSTKIKEKHSKDYINKTETNYGFIDTKGTFIPVSFGNHEAFARCLSEEKNWNLNDESLTSSFSTTAYVDLLVLEKGYVLLDNPIENGLPAQIYYNVSKGLNKKQKETLYDYLTSHDRKAEANSLYNDEKELNL